MNFLSVFDRIWYSDTYTGKPVPEGKDHNMWGVYSNIYPVCILYRRCKSIIVMEREKGEDSESFMKIDTWQSCSAHFMKILASTVYYFEHTCSFCFLLSICDCEFSDKYFTLVVALFLSSDDYCQTFYCMSNGFNCKSRNKKFVEGIKFLYYNQRK